MWGGEGIERNSYQLFFYVMCCAIFWKQFDTPEMDNKVNPWITGQSQQLADQN